MLAPGRKTKKVFFSFNLPKSGRKQKISHFLAAAITMMLLLPLSASIWQSLSSPIAQMEFMLSTMYGRLLPPDLLLPPLGCVLGLYGISWFTELDENSPMEKIESLSVPKLWKSLADE